ncbi:MAG: ATP-binding cassette domain-containing protein [Acidimicrobiales bacterium]|nr:ATP-binding cassette domain-containing protein [Acidimicrobiales bacterium]
MLDIQGLSKRYGDIVAVDDVALAVKRGRIVGFVGPNGAGKSTTMRSIFGLVEPDSGSISWDGAPVDRRALARFGYMPEQRGLYPKMKVAEQIAFFAELKGVDRSTAGQRATAILDTLGLADRRDDAVEKLSHGNQQRVQLAVSLVTEPELLVLDEPFNGLDPVAVETLQQVLRARVSQGVGVLFSSHQLDLVERICDEIVVIVAGRVRASGTVAAVRGASGARVCTIEVDRPTASLTEVVDAPVLRSTATSVVVEVGSDGDLDDLLARARRAGPIVRFDYDLPSLQDAFTRLAEGIEL